MEPEPEDDLDERGRATARTAGALLMAYLVDQDMDAVGQLVEEIDSLVDAQLTMTAMLVLVHNIFAADLAARERAISEALSRFTPDDLSSL